MCRQHFEALQNATCRPHDTSHISALFEPIKPFNPNVTFTVTVLRIHGRSAQAYRAAGDKRARTVNTALA
jgi:hypothetical protein